MFVDTHCHLDYPDYLEKDNKKTIDIINEAKDDGVEKIISISASPESLDRTKQLATEFKEVYFSQGIHPSELENYKESDLIKIEKNIKDTKCLAIGEIGLDYHYEPFDKKKQIELFVKQLDIAQKYQKPVIIHSRDAEDDIYNILKDFKNIKNFIVHSYTGSKESLKKFLDLGAFISFNGIITFKNATNVQELARFSPIDRILLETDAPYLAPTPYRGKLNYPKYIPIIAESLAGIKGLDLNGIEEQVFKNFMGFF